MKKAFTMLELVFVIVVIGILSIFIAPKMQNDRLNELAHQIITDLRYTQHLAMQDNKFDATKDDWHKTRWQLSFNVDTTSNLYYTVWSNKNKNNAFSKNEVAIDQATRKWMTGRSTSPFENIYIESMDLRNEYDIKSYSICGLASNKRIYFDYLGRAYIRDTVFGDDRFSGMLPSDCNLTLTNSDGKNVTITITAETGYAYIAR